MQTFHVTDNLGNQIRLTDERIGHIVNSHNEMTGRIHLVVRTVEDPDMVRIDPGSPSIRNYFRRLEGPGSTIHVRVAVVFDEDDDFVVTAHLIDRDRLMRRGELLWERA